MISSESSEFLSKSTGIKNPRHTPSSSGVWYAVSDVGDVNVPYAVIYLVTPWLVVSGTDIRATLAICWRTSLPDPWSPDFRGGLSIWASHLDTRLLWLKRRCRERAGSGHPEMIQQ
uniref:Uncharacterized protein n=1 Tax=Glossina palpalis gambiensis TaxID=67801 RepID=A0A1B0C1J3_9MUSC